MQYIYWKISLIATCTIHSSLLHSQYKRNCCYSINAPLLYLSAVLYTCFMLCLLWPVDFQLGYMYAVREDHGSVGQGQRSEAENCVVAINLATKEQHILVSHIQLSSSY